MKKRVFLLSLLFTFLFSLSVFADDDAKKTDWIGAGTCDHVSTPLFSYGTWGYEGTAGYRKPWQAEFFQIDKCCTVFVENPSNNLRGDVVIFSSEAKGTYGHCNYASDPNAVPTMSDLTWLSVNGTPSTGIFAGFEDYFDFTGKTVYYKTFSLNYDYVDMNVDYVIQDWSDLYSALASDNFIPPSSPDYSSGYDGLPFLAYQVKRSIVPQLSLNVTTTKLSLLWNYQSKEPYLSNPNAYTFDIKAWANFTDYNGSEIFDVNNLDVNDNNVTYITNGGYNISVNEYSWLYSNIGQSIYNKSQKTFRDDSVNSASLGYMVAIRTRAVDNSKTSYWKIFKCQAGGYLISTDKCLDDNDNVVPIPPDTTDGNDDLNTNNNGVPNYSDDNTTSAQSDPTGDVYDNSGDYDVNTLFSNLKSLVNNVKELPQLLLVVLPFFPEWLIQLMFVSIGMLVVVGFIKIVLR